MKDPNRRNDAFAVPATEQDGGGNGLSKREYVAARMMAALLTGSTMQRDPAVPSVHDAIKNTAKLAVAAADALMQALGDGEQLNASLVRSAKSALNLLERCGVKTGDVSTLARLREAVESAEKSEHAKTEAMLENCTEQANASINGDGNPARSEPAEYHLAAVLTAAHSVLEKIRYPILLADEKAALNSLAVAVDSAERSTIKAEGRAS